MNFDALTLFWILVAYLVGRIPFEATRRARHSASFSATR